MLLKCQKELFNLDPGIHYLNCAYKAPMLRSVERAGVDAIIRERNPQNLKAIDFFNEVEETRKIVASLLNCSDQNISFVPSTSYGFSSALNNIKSKSNGCAITIKNEFPSGFFSLKAWCNKNQNELKVIKKPETKNWNETIISAIDANTSIVLMSSVHWMNGYKFDLKSISAACLKYDAKLLVDGTQSVGVLPLDLEDVHIDALVCATYKWLFGPYSLGIAYYNDSFEDAEPLEESWMNRTNAKDFTSLTDYDENYQPKAGRFNVGETSNLILMPMLKAGLTQVLKWKPGNIQSYCQSLKTEMNSYLDRHNLPEPDRMTQVAHLFGLPLPPGQDLTKLQASLKENQIYTSLRSDTIRVSLNVFNDSVDIEQLIKAIEQA